MKVFTPEISWHQKEPIFSVDFCTSTWKLASAGADFTIKIWQLKEDNEGNIGLDFLANLDRHSKPVNCVRFSPDGKFLASAGDDCTIIIWKLSDDEDDHIAAETSFGSEDIVSKEKWVVHKMLRRGHLEDIYDLAWSPDGNQLISGSVDNSAIIWDISKGHFTNIIKDHKHYVQGVCWDPRGQYVVTHSSDRTCKVYSLTKNKCVHTIQKSTFPISNPEEDGPKQKSAKLFMDETMQSFFRRCRFSPDGLLLALPGGIYDSGEKSVKATYVYTRGGFNKPALCLPGSKKASVGVCFCPIIFENMTNNEAKDNQSTNESLFKLPYRMCYAVATLNSIIFYDTQHPHPFGFVSNVHYASLTDMTWSSDGRIVVVSSLDGYCSIISFENGELGKPSSINPMEYVSNKLKAKREAKMEAMKEAKKVQLESKTNVIVVNDKEKEQTVTTKPSPARTKDQPTLHQFVTPVRKRKRTVEKGESSQTPPSNTQPTLSPISNASCTVTPQGIPGKGSSESPIDLTVNHQSPATQTPSATEQQKVTPVSSATKSTKVPKHASLLSLGFKPIAKPQTNASVTVEEGNVAKPTETSNQNTIQNQQGKPRRINFVTDLTQTASSAVPISPSPDADLASEQPKCKTEDNQYNDGAAQCQATCKSRQQGKEPRRITLISLSTKRDHSGTLKEAGIKDVVTNENAIKQNSVQINDPVNNIDKLTTDSNSRQVLEVKSVSPKQKPTRRIEVITLSDDNPDPDLPPKLSTTGQQLFPGSSTSDIADKTTEKSIVPDSLESFPIDAEEITSLNLGLPLPVVSQKSTMASTIDATTKKPQNVPVNNSPNRCKVAGLQPPMKDVSLEEQAKGGSSPPIKAPKRVGFVTLSTSNSKQHKS